MLGKKMRGVFATGSLGWLVAALALSCGGNVTSSNDASERDASTAGGSSSDGSTDSQQSLAQVFAFVAIGGYYDPNHNAQNTCGSYSSLIDVFEIGTTNSNCDPKTGVCSAAFPVRALNGSSQSAGATVNVTCSVRAGFDVNLQASLGAMGSVQITGHVDASSGGKGLTGEITFSGQDYQSNNCNVTYAYMGQAVPVHPPIAPGRIWAHVSCPQMGDPTGVRHKTLMDGSQVPDSCDGEADFVFENCTQ
jgi:hypothetical protein